MPSVRLMTPGPLTTRIETRRAMLRDWGARDSQFIALTSELRQRLLAVANGHARYTAIPIQGSGTFAIEAAIATLVSRNSKLLVLVNGVYGERIANIASRLGRPNVIMRWAETSAVSAEALRSCLTNDREITHVAMVHCETTTGILNPLDAVARVTSAAGRKLIVDAISSFGALDLDLEKLKATAIVGSANKCLEGPPGLAFVVADQVPMALCQGNCESLSLDLYEQWENFERTGQWRFTPPVQVVAGLVEALRYLEVEGGPPARVRRFSANLNVLLSGMVTLGFRPLIDISLQAPIIVTFQPPEGVPFDFDALYTSLASRGFVIYPGKLTKITTLRIGCMGALKSSDYEALVREVARFMK